MILVMTIVSFREYILEKRSQRRFDEDPSWDDLELFDLIVVLIFLNRSHHFSPQKKRFYKSNIYIYIYYFQYIFDSSFHFIDRISDFSQMNDFDRDQSDTTCSSYHWIYFNICNDHDRDQSYRLHDLTIVRITSSNIHW